ncbi:MAG TPA: hypothetical protein VNT79_15225, partial [Phycisphaerae bacterium]|nr:hypothetical protein [Phycisphaerae bacterium]
MKIVGAIIVDLAQSPIGTRSHLCDELHGQPMLRRTVERTMQATSLSGLHLIVPQAQVERVTSLVAGLPVHLETHAAAPAAFQTLVRAGRRWGLDSWRGGAGG